MASTVKQTRGLASLVAGTVLHRAPVSNCFTSEACARLAARALASHPMPSQCARAITNLPMPSHVPCLVQACLTPLRGQQRLSLIEAASWSPSIPFPGRIFSGGLWAVRSRSAMDSVRLTYCGRQLSCVKSLDRPPRTIGWSSLLMSQIDSTEVIPKS